MRKLLYFIFAFTFIGCSDNAKEEDCGCVKTTRGSGWNGNRRYNVVKSVENVPCQDNNIPYVFVSGNTNTSDNLVYYSICCDNIDDPNSECN
jgi:hypothetical protein